MTSDFIALRTRYQTIQDNIQIISKNANRVLPPVLLAVSKGVAASTLRELYNIGQRRFAESYWQEAVLKQQALQDLVDIEWHFIGRLQSNKLAEIAQNFSWIHSVADLKHARKLNDYAVNKTAPLNICLQVNLSNEQTKAGFGVVELYVAMPEILTLSHLQLRGLMILPRQGDIESFTKLAELLIHLNQMFALHMDTLSMGMSQDYEAAIQAGSTMVRIGGELFAELKQDKK